MSLSTSLRRVIDSATRTKRACRPELTVLEARTVMNATVLSIAASPNALWPPNGRLVPVTVSGVIHDDDGNGIGANYRVRDEYGAVQPRGPVALSENPNGTFSYSFSVLLQARRSGQDRDGRQYQIVVTAFDDHSSDRAVTVVTVPHDRGNRSGVGLPKPPRGRDRFLPILVPGNQGDDGPDNGDNSHGGNGNGNKGHGNGNGNKGHGNGNNGRGNGRGRG